MSGFLNMLGRIGYGMGLSECDEKLTTLIKAVKENNASGKLTVEMTIKPLSCDNDGNVSQVEINYKVKHTLPEPIRNNTLLFIKGDDLTVRDPRQPELPKIVPTIIADKPQQQQQTGNMKEW